MANQQIILIHDRYNYFQPFIKTLTAHGFVVQAYSSGGAFLEDWQDRKGILRDSTGIMIHKDLGQNGGGFVGVTCEQVLSTLRADVDGVILRTVLCSGEYSYTGVRNESINLYRADAGYDPTSAQNIPRIVPDWVAEYLRLGIVGHDEALAFRGVSLVEHRFGVNERKQWLEGGLRHKEF